MQRKKAGTFIFIPSVLVAVFSLVAHVNNTLAELNSSSSTGKLVTCAMILTQSI